jgi:hypothetical protein
LRGRALHEDDEPHREAGQVLRRGEPARAKA